MILKKLELEGITRFQRPVEVDFEALGEGVVAIVGPNGAGKTSILECSGPGTLFRELPFRTPSSIETWMNPGGARTALTFQHGEHSYKAEVELGKKLQARLVKDGKKITSGLLGDYDDEILKLFKDKRAFYASAFGVQNGKGRFASLGVADRKAVFRIYLGLDYLDELRAAVKKRMDEIDYSAVGHLESSISTLEAEAARADNRARELHAQTEKTRETFDATEKRLSEVSELADAVELLSAYDETCDAIKETQAKLATLRSAPVAGRKLGDAKLEEALTELYEDQRALRDLERRLNDADLALTRQVAEHDAVNRLLTDYQHRAATLSSVPCGGEGKYATCPLLVDAQGAKAKIPTTQKRLDSCKAVLDKGTKAKDAIGLQVKEISGVDALIEEANRRKRDHERLRAVEEANAKQIGQLTERTSQLEARLAELHGKLPDPLPEDLPTKKDIDVLKEARDKARSSLDEAMREESREEGKLTTLTRDLDARRKELLKVKRTSKDATALRLLDKALGPDGVQALEIDAAGPGVSDILNSLLTSCYGPRFSVSVQTLRKLKSREGVAEDFDLRVTDAERGGEERMLASLSGGEQVVIDEAFRMASCLFTSRRWEEPTLTLWRDETVGALDHDNALRYVQMLKKARELGGFHQIIYVTHDDRAVLTADAVIRISESGEVNCH